MLPIDEAVGSKIKSPPTSLPIIAESNINKCLTVDETKDGTQNYSSQISVDSLDTENDFKRSKQEQSLKEQQSIISDVKTDENPKLKNMNRTKRKSAIKVSKSKFMQKVPVRVNRSRITKKKNTNINKKCNLSIEDELRIINDDMRVKKYETMENNSTNDESTEVCSTDEDKKEYMK